MSNFRYIRLKKMDFVRYQMKVHDVQIQEVEQKVLENLVMEFVPKVSV